MLTPCTDLFGDQLNLFVNLCIHKDFLVPVEHRCRLNWIRGNHSKTPRSYSHYSKSSRKGEKRVIIEVGNPDD